MSDKAVKRETSLEPRRVRLYERDRAAQDLYDHVIHGMFAVGMSLQAALVSETNGRRHLEDAIREIDRIIGDIRGSALRPVWK